MGFRFFNPRRICDKLVRAHHPVHLQFLVCRSILGELEEVLGGKIGMPASMVDERMKYVIRHSLLVALEKVDWSPFDFVGVDLYRDAKIKDVFEKMVRGYLVYDKPVVIGEFGCCTYRGADLLGGSGFIIMFGIMADYLVEKVAVPPPFNQMLSVIPKN